MNETEIKTRLGYILQNLVAEALGRAGYSYAMDPQYDPACEKPDFLIPNETAPKFMVEVHQTEARNSFQMKTLRAFTAVVEGKARFGDQLTTINILFGDPDNELPAANVSAMCSFFDANLIPRNDDQIHMHVVTLEDAALASASVAGQTVAASSQQIIASHPGAVDSLADALANLLKRAVARADMNPLWKLERDRVAKLGPSPEPGANTYYKRMMLRSLYLEDKDFDELVALQDPGLCSQSTLKQLIATDLVDVQEDIDGDTYVLVAGFEHFLRDPDAVRLRDLCKARLDAEPAMHWFFEDIRDKSRRRSMVAAFCSRLVQGEAAFSQAFEESFRNGSALGIDHARCWIADLMPLAFGLSHNYFNGRMFRLPEYTLNLGNPFNNITIRSDRLGSDPDALDIYQKAALKVFYGELLARNLHVTAIDISELEGRLFRFRLDAAIKLRKLDPLYLVSDEICRRLGLVQEKVPVSSVVGDLARSAAAGKFKAWRILGGKRSAIMMNAVAVHDNNGDHKSKEWGARRLATLYRLKKGTYSTGEYEDALFVLDGEWAQKDVQRLHRDGWNHICRLGNLEAKLKEIFQI